MAAADPTAAICAYLAAQPDITALIGGNSPRIFRPELPQTETSSMPRGCVVVRTAGGYQMFGKGLLPLADPRIDVLCYGSVRLEADTIGRECAVALKALEAFTDGQAVLKWARITGGPLPLVDGSTGPLWPFSLVSIQVAHAEQTAA